MRIKLTPLVLLACLSLSNLQAQVGVGTTEPDASAALDVESTTQGFLPPRMTTAQRDAINSTGTPPGPAEGLTIYNIDNKCVETFNATVWISLCDGFASPGDISNCSTSGFIVPYITAAQTKVVPVTNPITGETWMDRNLGAMRPAEASDDCFAYGNLYQWGRAGEGHESRTSGEVSTQATTATPNTGGAWDGQFITGSVDWLSTPDNTLWQGVIGPNNPCPAGYRIPNDAELTAERDSWDGTAGGGYTGTTHADDALNSTPLKLPLPGLRSRINGDLSSTGSIGFYWSSTVASGNINVLAIDAGSANISGRNRAFGYAVRCIKD